MTTKFYNTDGSSEQNQNKDFIEESRFLIIKWALQSGISVVFGQ